MVEARRKPLGGVRGNLGKKVCICGRLAQDWAASEQIGFTFHPESTLEWRILFPAFSRTGEERLILGVARHLCC